MMGQARLRGSQSTAEAAGLSTVSVGAGVCGGAVRGWGAKVLNNSGGKREPYPSIHPTKNS